MRGAGWGEGGREEREEGRGPQWARLARLTRRMWKILHMVVKEVDGAAIISSQAVGRVMNLISVQIFQPCSYRVSLEREKEMHR